MSVQRRLSWCSAARPARGIDRRLFLASAASAFAASAAVPLWARGLSSYPPPDRELMAPVPGGRVYVRVNGPLDGPVPPLVLIHGGPGGTMAGLLNALALADERAVIFYDQLDSGRSDHPNDPRNWTVARFVAEVDAVRRAVGVKRWHVLGHSWGGTIALEYGARRPPQLAGLVLASPLISTRSWLADAAVLRRELPANVQELLNKCEHAHSLFRLTRPPSAAACAWATDRYYAAFNRREPPSQAQSDFKRTQDGAGFNNELYHAMWGSSEFASSGTLRNYNGEPLLAKLDGSHTLFMAGQYDEARPTTVAGFAERVIGAQFALVHGAAHGFLNDRPEEALQILRSWLWTQDQA